VQVAAADSRSELTTRLAAIHGPLLVGVVRPSRPPVPQALPLKAPAVQLRSAGRRKPGSKPPPLGTQPGLPTSFWTADGLLRPVLRNSCARHR
jgi:hypothetical protein